MSKEHKIPLNWTKDKLNSEERSLKKLAHLYTKGDTFKVNNIVSFFFNPAIWAFWIFNYYSVIP